MCTFLLVTRAYYMLPGFTFGIGTKETFNKNGEMIRQWFQAAEADATSDPLEPPLPRGQNHSLQHHHSPAVYSASAYWDTYSGILLDVPYSRERKAHD